MTEWSSLEDTVASLTKNQIFKLLQSAGLDSKEYAKIMKRKTQTSREDLATTFTKTVKKSTQNTKE